jgi:hypothetical protein
MAIKRRLGRSNWPFEAVWAAGGEKQIYYIMDNKQAELWLAATVENGEMPCEGDQ